MCVCVCVCEEKEERGVWAVSSGRTEQIFKYKSYQLAIPFREVCILLCSKPFSHWAKQEVVLGRDPLPLD